MLSISNVSLLLSICAQKDEERMKECCNYQFRFQEKHRAAVFCSILRYTYSQGHAFCKTNTEFSYIGSYTSEVPTKFSQEQCLPVEGILL